MVNSPYTDSLILLPFFSPPITPPLHISPPSLLPHLSPSSLLPTSLCITPPFLPCLPHYHHSSLSSPSIILPPSLPSFSLCHSSHLPLPPSLLAALSKCPCGLLDSSLRRAIQDQSTSPTIYKSSVMQVYCIGYIVKNTAAIYIISSVWLFIPATVNQEIYVALNSCSLSSKMMPRM